MPCDKDRNNLIDLNEFKGCSIKAEYFSRMIKFNSEWIKDIDKFVKQVFNSFDTRKKDHLNLYDYVKLRNFNNAYNILLIKESKVYYKNFGVSVHMISKNL